MRTLKLLLMFSMIFIALPARAADKVTPENSEAQKQESPPERAERPKREAVKLSPHPRESASRPDESGRVKRVAPPRAESPLQNVPALMDPPPGVKPSENR